MNFFKLFSREEGTHITRDIISSTTLMPSFTSEKKWQPASVVVRLAIMPKIFSTNFVSYVFTDGILLLYVSIKELSILIINFTIFDILS